MWKKLPNRTISSLRHNQHNKASVIQICHGFDVNKRHIHYTKPKQIGKKLIVGVGVVAAIAYYAKTFGSKTIPGAMKQGESILSSLVKERLNESEDKMTRKEAALVLGVKETSEKEEILQAYNKKTDLLNNPDSSESTVTRAQIDEAKDKMLAGEN